MQIEVTLLITGFLLSFVLLILVIILASNPGKKKNLVNEDIKKIKDQITE
jgi:hypothetical protein